MNVAELIDQLNHLPDDAEVNMLRLSPKCGSFDASPLSGIDITTDASKVYLSPRLLVVDWQETINSEQVDLLNLSTLISQGVGDRLRDDYAR